MFKFIEQLWICWDVRMKTPVPFAVYNVTPRQGRHAIRRKLLRQLARRLEAKNQPPSASESHERQGQSLADSLPNPPLPPEK